jgi:hypothetical protein
MSLVTISTQLGAELINLRKIHALREHVRLADNAEYNRRLLVRSDGYANDDNEEARALAHTINYFDDNLRQVLESEYRNLRDIMQDPEDGFFSVLAAEILASKEDIESAPIVYEHEDVNGAILIKERRGLWGAFVRWLELNGDYASANAVTPGTLTPGPGNVGELEDTALVFKGHCPTGVFTFKCTSEDISAPKFSVSLKIDTGSVLADGTSRRDAASELQAERAFSDGVTGCDGVILTRPGLAAPTEFNDGDALVDNMVFSNPGSGDFDEGGSIYMFIERLADDNWMIAFYNNSGRSTGAAGSFLATGTSGTASISGVLFGGTSVSFDFDKSAADGALGSVGDTDDDIYFDIETPREGESWTLAVTNDYAGSFATKLLHVAPVSLPTSGDGDEITDSLADSVSME